VYASTQYAGPIGKLSLSGCLAAAVLSGEGRSPSGDGPLGISGDTTITAPLRLDYAEVVPHGASGNTEDAGNLRL